MLFEMFPDREWNSDGLKHLIGDNDIGAALIQVR